MLDSYDSLLQEVMLSELCKKKRQNVFVVINYTYCLHFPSFIDLVVFEDDMEEEKG